MNKAFCLLIFLPLTLDCHAQKHESKFSAEISIGPSLPVGKFADKSVSKDTVTNLPGRANVGIALAIAFNYRVSKIFSAILLVGGQQNKQNVQSMNNYFELYSTSGNDVYRTQTQDWKIGKIMAGLSLKIPMSNSNKIYFKPVLLAGVLKTSVPGYHYAIYQLLTNGSAQPVGFGTHSGYALAWSFCFQAGTGVSYQYNSRVFFSGNINYFHATPSRSYTVYTIFPPPPGNGKPYEVNYPIAAINVMVGAGVNF